MSALLAIIRHNIRQCLVSWDQALTCTALSLLVCWEKSWADETLSARAHRRRLAGKPWLARMIDWFFGLFGDKDHCKEACESERFGRQLPPELR